MGIKSWILGVGFFTCILAMTSTEVKGSKTMNAETFFSGQQLSAYQLAQKGDSNGLAQATKSGGDLNRPGREDMTLLGSAVLNADRQAIVSLVRAGADHAVPTSPYFPYNENNNVHLEPKRVQGVLDK